MLVKGANGVIPNCIRNPSNLCQINENIILMIAVNGNAWRSELNRRCIWNIIQQSVYFIQSTIFIVVVLFENIPN